MTILNNLGRKFTLALQCFIDESADGFGNHTVVMAGYVADEETWENFSKDWNAELKRRKWEFVSFNNGIFKGGKATNNAEVFYRIIEKHLDKAFCVECSVLEYRTFMASCVMPKSLTESPRYALMNDPYMFLYRAFIEFCYYEGEKIGITEPVNLIFDETKKYEGIISAMYEYFYHSAIALGVDETKIGKKPVFMDDEVTPALQAADFLARLIRTNRVNGGSLTETAMPWKKNKPIQCLTATVGKDYLLQILDNAFSEKNLEMYEKYTKQRHYRL